MFKGIPENRRENCFEAVRNVIQDNLNIDRDMYNAFNVYRRELAPGTVSLTGDRAQGDDSKHWAYCTLSEPTG